MLKVYLRECPYIYYLLLYYLHHGTSCGHSFHPSHTLILFPMYRGGALISIHIVKIQSLRSRSVFVIAVNRMLSIGNSCMRTFLDNYALVMKTFIIGLSPLCSKNYAKCIFFITQRSFILAANNLTSCNYLEPYIVDNKKAQKMSSGLSASPMCLVALQVVFEKFLRSCFMSTVYADNFCLVIHAHTHIYTHPNICEQFSELWTGSCPHTLP